MSADPSTGRGPSNERVMKRLLTRGNSLGGVVAAALKLLARGEDVPADDLLRYERELRAWTADVRAVASEEHGSESDA